MKYEIRQEIDPKKYTDKIHITKKDINSLLVNQEALNCRLFKMLNMPWYTNKKISGMVMIYAIGFPMPSITP